MNDTDNIGLPDYRVDGSGTISATEAGLAIDRAYREAEGAFDALQQCWAGACLAGLFVRHPWLQSLRATLSASAEYDDQGSTYRSISNAVTQAAPVAGAALPDAVTDEGRFDELGAIAVIEADLDELDFDLYTSIHAAPDDYADLVLDLNRTAIASLMNGLPISGAEAYRAWFPENPASLAVA
jgi:hypothetical protein